MTGKITRRALLAAPGLLPLAVEAANAQAANAPTSGAPQRANSKTLVACFSRSGNTRVIAGTLQRELGADLFEIRPERPYPDDYEETVAQATRERDSGFEPPLEAVVADIAAYDAIFLGLPIWGETAPPVIRSFLRAHDLTGKTLRPFITHGGFGVGSSMAVITAHASGAHIEQPLVMEADQERRTLRQVRDWLAQTRR
jgi:flavodoxin